MQQLILRCFLKHLMKSAISRYSNPKNHNLNRILPAALLRFFNLTFNYAQ